jgi:hypothetical protein
MPILTGNIFGVDLDQQAVEIARLNLLLRGLAKRDHLPPLTDNIKRGNSLISGTDAELKGYFGDNWHDKHPFNWEYEFKDIMKNGGFDIVIGNPPYLLLQPQNIQEKELIYIHNNYAVAQYKVDIFHLFIEQGISILKENGILGYILPNTFLMNIYTNQLRKFILGNCRIVNIVVIPNQVFPEAKVDNAIIILQKESNDSKRKTNTILLQKVTQDENLNDIKFNPETKIYQKVFYEDKNFLFNVNLGGTQNLLWSKILTNSCSLEKLAEIHFGLQTRDRRLHPTDVIETLDLTKVVDPYHACLSGKDIQRYCIDFSNQYVFFDDSIRAGGCWDSTMHLANKKIIVRQIGKYPIASLDDKPYCCLNTVFMVKGKQEQPDLLYILGIINSQLIKKYWINHFYDQKFLFPKIKGSHLKQLPIRQIDFDNPSEKAMHDKLVSLVEKMLELNKKLAPLRDTNCEEKDELLKEIEKTDKEIDELVYQLYELTPEEIVIVEENSK